MSSAQTREDFYPLQAGVQCFFVSVFWPILILLGPFLPFWQGYLEKLPPCYLRGILDAVHPSNQVNYLSCFRMLFDHLCMVLTAFFWDSTSILSLQGGKFYSVPKIGVFFLIDFELFLTFFVPLT